MEKKIQSRVEIRRSRVEGPEIQNRLAGVPEVTTVLRFPDLPWQTGLPPFYFSLQRLAFSLSAPNPTKTLKIQTVPRYSLSTARYSLKLFHNSLKIKMNQLKLVQTVPKKRALSGTVWYSLKSKAKWNRRVRAPGLQAVFQENAFYPKATSVREPTTSHPLPQYDFSLKNFDQFPIGRRCPEKGSLVLGLVDAWSHFANASMDRTCLMAERS